MSRNPLRTTYLTVRLLAMIPVRNSYRFQLSSYLSISDVQFKIRDKGAALGSSTFVLIRNF